MGFHASARELVERLNRPGQDVTGYWPQYPSHEELQDMTPEGRRAAMDRYYAEVRVYYTQIAEAQRKEVTAELQAAFTFSIFRDHSVRPFPPEWRTEAVVAMARTVLTTFNPSVLPVLADALDDAGCDDTSLLAYCRSGSARPAEAVGVIAPILGSPYSEAVDTLCADAATVGLTFNTLMEVGRHYVDTDGDTLVEEGRERWRNYFTRDKLEDYWAAWSVLNGGDLPDPQFRGDYGSPFDCSC